jgi:hypothetical protein
VEFCSLEASSAGVKLIPATSNNSSSDFAAKSVSGDGSSRVTAPGPLDPSLSAVKAPYSNQVGYCLFIILVSSLKKCDTLISIVIDVCSSRVFLLEELYCLLMRMHRIQVQRLLLVVGYLLYQQFLIKVIYVVIGTASFLPEGKWSI